MVLVTAAKHRRWALLWDFQKQYRPFRPPCGRYEANFRIRPSGRRVIKECMPVHC